MVKTSRVLKYTMLPGIIPRCGQLLSSSFSFSAYSIASIFYSVRLLPRNHPYTIRKNIGKFGIRNVIAAAANNLEFSWKKADQIFIYIMILSAIVLLFGQFILMGISLFAQQEVLAAVSDYFSRTDDKHADDLVMVTMDRIFGVAGIFNSCVSIAGTYCHNINDIQTTDYNFPFPFHYALHEILSFYSKGLFFVSIFIVLYFVAVVVGETAISGSPLGQRYNKTWVPLRIILFLALLVPIPQGGSASGAAKVNGMNVAQLLTLWIAKTGSDFASNGWDVFTDQLQLNNIIAAGQMPRSSDVMKFMFIARTCKLATELNYKGQGATQDWIKPYVVKSKGKGNPLLLTEATYNQALQYAEGAAIRIVFGATTDDTTNPFYSQAQKSDDKIIPICGEMQLMNTGGEDRGYTNLIEGPEVNVVSPATKIQELYYDNMGFVWEDDRIINAAACYASYSMPELGVANVQEECDTDSKELQEKLMNLLNEDHDSLSQNYDTISKKLEDVNLEWSVMGRLKDRGWAGAALLYNQIAEENGRFGRSLQGLPEIKAMPDIMQYVADEKQKMEQNTSASDQYNPLIGGGKYVHFDDKGDANVARALHRAYTLFDKGVDLETQSVSTHSNLVETIIRDLFGAQGLFDLRENADINPMAQLSSLGQGIMDASLRNIVSGAIVGKIVENWGGQESGQIQALTGVIHQIGYITLTMGFSLYYILPMMPFLYFFFAFAGWVKGIFEAIVAMPLWAMAHVARWDGEGVVGPAAQNGYFLLFEIFLRPIMIVFGLLASISIFSASVSLLNDVYEAVVTAISGADFSEFEEANDLSVRSIGSAVDELFLLMVYAILCYMMGLSSFKLIDQIPNEILRWMGVNVRSFQDGHENAAQGISSKTYQGSSITTSKLGGMTMSAAQHNAMG